MVDASQTTGFKTRRSGGSYVSPPPDGQRSSRHSRASSVLSLLFHSGPAAVFWGIRTIIVNTLNRVAWRWGFPHVAEEVIERSAPALANSNSAPPVPLEHRVSRVIASLLDCTPGAVFLCIAKSVRFASLRINFAYPTPAGFWTFRFVKLFAANNTCIAAFALTKPCGAITQTPASFKNFQFPESLSGKVKCWSSCIHSKGLYHSHEPRATKEQRILVNSQHTQEAALSSPA